MRAEDIMTTDVVAVPETTDVVNLARVLLERHISGVPVVNADGQVVGIVTKTDLTAATLEKSVEILLIPKAEDLFPDTPQEEVELLIRTGVRTARDVMTSPPLTATRTTPVQDLAALMRAHRVHRILIVEEGRLCGIVTAMDVLKCFHPPQV